MNGTNGNVLEKNPALKNFTRTSQSLVRKLWERRDFSSLILYAILRQSDLGREGIERSGSYRFADHLYRREPSGKGWFGQWLDARLLNLPASRAFQRRYLEAANTLSTEWRRFRTEGNDGGPFRVLGLPCGLPRDLVDFVRAEDSNVLDDLRYTGMDLDTDVLNEARKFCEVNGLGGKATFHRGDALNLDDYPEDQFDLIISTGLGEFLGDEELASFYGNVHDRLRPGGVFYTSATLRDARSERMLSAFELRTNYRDGSGLQRLLNRREWSHLSIDLDPSGLQVFVRARR